ncbi:hypothetical protein HKI87_02g17660 [Chloropicon roscoffensis]|uniref:Uncharacterized protein n=1 Tax=Chloropicon roscoffensis TaxID=1461544 RepID=A0AAX4P1S3_9CHLO
MDSPAVRRAKRPLVHSPLGERNGPRRVTLETPSSLPLYQAKPKPKSYEALWREAEDRAASLSDQLKAVRDRERQIKESVDAQRRMLSHAASEVKAEVSAAKAELQVKESELDEARREADEARDRQSAVVEELKRAEGEVESLRSALEAEQERVGELTALEDEERAMEAQTADLNQQKVVHLERSLAELSAKLKDLSTAELESEPYPHEMKSNHVWQQATNAAKARSRGQRAAAFAGQARAEARVSALQRELDAQVRRNLNLEKEVQVTRFRSTSTEEKLEREGQHVLRMSQELEGISKKFRETEADSQVFGNFVGRARELASSLLSEIEPSDMGSEEGDSDLEEDDGSQEGELEAEGSKEGESRYAAALNLLATAVRKSKAAMRYAKASARAQLQAKEVALREAHDDREQGRKLVKELRAARASLELECGQLSDKCDDLESLLASSSTSKERSLAKAQNDLERAREDADDLVAKMEALRSERDGLESDVRSLEAECRRTASELEVARGEAAEGQAARREGEELRSRLEESERLREEAASQAEGRAEVAETEVARLRQVVEEGRREMRALESANEDLRLGAEEGRREARAVKEDAGNLRRANEELSKSLEGVKRRLEGSILDSADRERSTQSLRNLAASHEHQIRTLEEELQAKDTELKTRRSSVADLEAKVVRMERTHRSSISDLNLELENLRVADGTFSAERRDLEIEVSRLASSLELCRAELDQERQLCSKRGVEVEKLNAYVTAMKVEVENHIDALSESNSTNADLNARLESSNKRAEEAKDRQESADRLVGQLREELGVKSEQVRLHGSSCRDLLVQIKESVAHAFGSEFPGVLDSVVVEPASKDESFDFDASAYESMRRLCLEVFPVLRGHMDEDRESVRQLRGDLDRLTGELKEILAREADLKSKLRELRMDGDRRRGEAKAGDTLRREVRDLKATLEGSTAKAAALETDRRRLESELAKVKEELESSRKDAKELGRVLGVFKEAEVHFSDQFSHAERALREIERAASALGDDDGVDGARRREEADALAESIGSLRESCAWQRDIIISRRGEGKAITPPALECHALLDVPTPVGSRSHSRPLWQKLATLPFRMLPAVALIVSSAKSDEIRHSARRLFAQRRGRGAADKEPPAKPAKRLELGAKPYVTAGSKTFDFDVPRNGTRELKSMS